MGSEVVDIFFNRSCALIKYRCEPGETFIDPCSCSNYFECEQPNSIIGRPCSAGTGYNHERNTCTDLNDLVLDGVCNQKRPWDRCPDDDEDADYYDDVDKIALEHRCTGVLPTTTPYPRDDGDDGGVDGGLIAGVIIAVLVVLVLVVLIVVYIRRKGNPLQNLRNKGSRSQRRSSPPPSYRDPGAGPREEETYAELDETAITDGKKLSHANQTYDVDNQEDVSYDNPALQRNSPPPPIPDSPPPPSPPAHQVPPEYSKLDERDRAPQSYSSLYEHKGASAGDCDGDRNSLESESGDDGYLVAEAIGGDSQRSSNPVVPDYHVLEKS